MLLTPSDIAQLIANSDEPSEIDGMTNIRRVYFIMNAFGMTNLDMENDFPFEEVMTCYDPTKVQASIHLAILQHQFSAFSGGVGYYPADKADKRCAWLHLWVLKMQWHLKHLQAGKATPPFPFLQ